MFLDRAAFDNISPTILQPKSASSVLFGGVWRKPLEILRGEGKASVMGLRHACRSSESPGKRFLFLLDNLALVLGASKGRGSAPSLNHMCREMCVISLATFTIHHDVDQCGPSATGSAPDRSCLLSSQPKPHELLVKKRKLESIREPAAALVLPTKVDEGWKTRRKPVRSRAHATAASLTCQHTLFGESSFLEQNRVTASTVQHCTVTLNDFLALSKMSMDELKVLAKLDEMVVEMLEPITLKATDTEQEIS